VVRKTAYLGPLDWPPSSPLREFSLSSGGRVFIVQSIISFPASLFETWRVLKRCPLENKLR